MMEEQIENNAAPAEEAGEPAAILPGAMLREARERIGMSVADAAAQTKLAPRQIEALEADDYQHLPEMAFVRGFVRSYAKLLQLDAQPLLAALPQSKPASVHMSPVSVDVPFPSPRSPQVQNLIWLGAALFLSVVVVAFAVWHFTSPGTPAKPEQQVESAILLPAQMQVIPASAVAEIPASSVAPAAPASQLAVPDVQAVARMPAVKLPQAAPEVKAVPPAAAVKAPAAPTAQPAPVVAKPIPAPAVPATKPVAPAATSVAAPAVKPAVKPSAATPATTTQPTSLRLTFGEESWTEVRDRNGNIVSSQLNPAGSELRLSGQGPFTLVVGRASSARLTYKGKTVDMKPNTNATSDVARVTLE